MEKVFTVESANRCVHCGMSHNTAVFAMPEEISLEVAEYFRLLSLNYSDYSSGLKPWPIRPGKLVTEGLDSSRYCC